MLTRRRGRTRTTAPTRPGVRLTAGLAAALLLAGCSGGGDDPTASGSTSSATPSSSTTASASGSATADPSASTAPSAVAPTGSLASKQFTVTTTYSQVRVPMRFDLVALQRRGDLLQVVASLTNTSTDRSQDMRWQVGTRFNPGEYRDDLTTTSGIFGGAILTDLPAGKRYLVAADSAKNCVCTVDLSGTFVGAGETVELVATYAAPPASTTRLDVEVPHLGLFRDVAIS